MLDKLKKNKDIINIKEVDNLIDLECDKNNILSVLKKLVKETEIPSGHDPDKYIVERIKAKSHDGRMIPISLVRLKKSYQLK